MENLRSIQDYINTVPVHGTVQVKDIAPKHNTSPQQTLTTLDNMQCLERQEEKDGKHIIWKKIFDPAGDLPKPRGEAPFTRPLPKTKCHGCHFTRSETGCTIRNENYWNKLEF